MRAKPAPLLSSQMKQLHWFIFSSFAISIVVCTPSFFAYKSIEFDCQEYNLTQITCFDWLHPRLQVKKYKEIPTAFSYMLYVTPMRRDLYQSP